MRGRERELSVMKYQEYNSTEEEVHASAVKKTQTGSFAKVLVGFMHNASAHLLIPALQSSNHNNRDSLVHLAAINTPDLGFNSFICNYYI